MPVSFELPEGLRLYYSLTYHLELLWPVFCRFTFESATPSWLIKLGILFWWLC